VSKEVVFQPDIYSDKDKRNRLFYHHRRMFFWAGSLSAIMSLKRFGTSGFDINSVSKEVQPLRLLSKLTSAVSIVYRQQKLYKKYASIRLEKTA